MHSSTEQQRNKDQNDCPYGTDMAQFILGSLFGPAVNMAMEVAQTASTIYTDRFEAAAPTSTRTNGKEPFYALGVKNSLGGSFKRAGVTTPIQKNDHDFALPYWKRDAGYAPRLAA